MQMMWRGAVAAAVIGLLSVTSAVAAPARIRGEIAAVDGKVLTIRTTSGEEVKVALADKVQVGAVARATLADIGSDAYVGAAGMPQPDGSVKAMEVHIFPAALRGAGEGNHDFDLAAGSTMTNAAVTGKVDVDAASGGGSKLTLTYKGGSKTLIVPPKTPIVKLVSGSISDVKPGVGIIVFRAEPGEGGTYTADRITVGKDGVNPPM